jgi:hypothetical protein
VRRFPLSAWKPYQTQSAAPNASLRLKPADSWKRNRTIARHVARLSKFA